MIPQNFTPVEQRIINVDDDGSDTGVQFTSTPPAGVSDFDCLVANLGTNPCQLLFASTLALAQAVVADGFAQGTAQVKIASGAVMTLRKGANKFAGAVCESGKTTTLYLTSGQGS